MLYEIWHVGKETYPLERILSVIVEYRDQIISTNYEKLKITCDHYNRIQYDDAYYEIREKKIDSEF